jgi:hypothetical protein
MIGIGGDHHVMLMMLPCTFIAALSDIGNHLGVLKVEEAAGLSH